MANRTEFHASYKGISLEVVSGDITIERVGAIVNAANENLSHIGGVAGAISKKGGPSIQDESDTYIRENGLVKTGQVAVTGPGTLPCQRIIHTVGPVYETGSNIEYNLLHKAVHNSLKIALKLELNSISIPAISSGVYGFPKDKCVEVIIDTTYRFIDEVKQAGIICFIQNIRFIDNDKNTVNLMKSQLQISSKKYQDDGENNEKNILYEKNISTNDIKLSSSKEQDDSEEKGCCGSCQVF
jgi:O-acetyl-ADP-ribose deacetylase